MKLKNILKTGKKVLIGLGTAYTLINIISPLIATQLLSNSKANEVSKETYKNYQTSNKKLNAIDYLNISNSIAYQVAKLRDDCTNYSTTTFEIYQKLVKINNRKDLEEKIRKAWGNEAFKGGHSWLEVFENNEWKPYETFNRTPINLNWETIKDYSKDSRKRKLKLNLFGSSPKFRSFPGSKITYPSLDSFTSFSNFLSIFIIEKENK